MKDKKAGVGTEDTLSTWADIIRRQGEQAREQRRETQRLVRDLEEKDTPLTPEEWAFYASHKKHSAEELNNLDESGKDFLTECFRAAIKQSVEQDTGFTEALKAFVKKHGYRVDSGTYGSGYECCVECGMAAHGKETHKPGCVVGTLLPQPLPYGKKA